MKQFEYATLHVNVRKTDTLYTFDYEGDAKEQQFYDFLRALNKLGEQGWEWVGMHLNRYVFKRQY